MSDPAGYGRGSIITPEAVVLDFESAGVASRSLAFAIDFIMQIIGLFGLLFVLGAVAATGSDVAAIVMLLVGLILVVLGYPIGMETLNRGRTVGRMVVGTRVVTVEGAPIRFRHAAIRGLLAIIDLYATLGGVAVIAALLSARGQRLGDMAAGTMVIREKTSKMTATPRRFFHPHHLLAWSASLDTSALGNDGYQLVRDYLVAVDSLAEPTRTSLGNEIADFVGERLPLHPRPPNIDSISYLLAIAATVQSGATGLAQPPPPLPHQRVDLPVASPPPPAWAQPDPYGPVGAPPPPPPPPRQPPAPPAFVPPSAAPPPPPPPAPPPAAPPAAPAEESEPARAPNEGGFATPG